MQVEQSQDGPARSALRRFLDSEAAGGLLLMGAAGLAMIVANSGLAGAYRHALETVIGPELVPGHPPTLHFWINDALMAVFFLLVGLEIKRELVDGRLSTWRQRRLPVVAAASGMAVPALLYLLVAGGDPTLARGWAIPAATDIAFAIGVLALLGRRVPTSLKLFLTTVAIVDDLGSVLIIALAYTDTLDVAALAAAAAILLVMLAMARLGVRRLAPFLIAALGLWYAVLLSGVHPTVAGVLAAATIPVIRTPGAPDAADSPLHRLEHAIAPLVAYLIVPLFGFANAGLSLAGIGIERALAPLPLAIFTGLVVGKQLGIFTAIWLSVRLGFAGRLGGASWLQVWGVSVLCGIGFTMSLFIGALAFPDAPALVEEAKLGVLFGSLTAAVIGFALLRFAAPHHDWRDEEGRIAREIAAEGDAIRIEAEAKSSRSGTRS